MEMQQRWVTAQGVALVVLALTAVSADRGVLLQDSPQAAVDALLDADRRASASAAAASNVVVGLMPMFTDDVVMPVPGNRFARGKAEVETSLASNADNLRSRAEWTPIRGGISADGQHGFTFGYMTMRRDDKVEIPLKYLAYWIKQPAGWRVAVYKRARRADGPVSTTLLAAALPPRMIPITRDSSAIAMHRDSVAQAEQAFSDEAQKIGLGPAFTKWGSTDAVNMGPPTTAAFVFGAAQIGVSVQGDAPAGPSPVSWSSDTVFVATSGDLGVSIGMIRPNKPAPNQPAGFPFFTIWRRATAKDAWRYVAE
jgi:ketosteroid isomerase-like protein